MHDAGLVDGRRLFQQAKTRAMVEIVESPELAARHAAALFRPSLADFPDQDLRDTAVTWLARAGCTPIEVAHITGHSLASVQTVLKHYLSAHREIGDNAIKRAVAWYEGATG